jgi:hypothetical protein
MPQEYIIYGVLGLLFLIFLIVSIGPRKKKYDKYETIFSIVPKPIEYKIELDEEKEEKPVQLSMFHENYQKEIEDITNIVETVDISALTPEENAEFTRDELRQMTLVELKEVAKQKDLHGYSRLSKVDLIDFIIDSL